MKKLVTVLLAVMMVLSFAACSSKNDGQENPITHYKTGDVTLGEYKGLKYKPTSTEVTDEEFNEYVDYLLSTQAKLTEKSADAVAEKGDVVSCDFVGKLDGVAFEGGTGSKDDLELGSGSFISDFEDGLIGKGLGKHDVPCKFPEEYHNAELAGKDVIFEITVKKISARVVPELDDEFCDTFTDGEHKTVDDFTAYLKNEIKSFKEQDAESNKVADLTELVIKNATFNRDLSTEVAESKDSILNYYNAFCSASYGVDAKTFYQLQYGFTDEQFNSFIDSQAEMSIKYRFVASAIAEAENVTVSDEEARKFADENYASLGYESVDAFFAAVKSQQNIEGLEYCREQVKLDKANDIVMQNAIPEE